MNDDEITYWLELCNNISENVEEAIAIAREDPSLTSITKIGADGTPTHKIDEYAENAAIQVLEDTGYSLILISEEIGTIKIGDDSAQAVIIMDPLDGTTNALKNLPCYGISIAVGKLEGDDDLENVTLDDIEVAYVKNFPTNDVYTAVKNRYATKNNKLISVSSVTEAKHATVSTYIYRTKRDLNKIFPNVRRMRIMGAIAVEMCYLAEGVYDVFLDTQAVRVLDIAASQLIIREAGGYITDIDSNELSSQIDLLAKTTIVATPNKSLQEDIVRLL
ncbi:bifunctional fructose-bisphosphatase/inositol-phosphate phosphatase [Methanosphaera sp. ISO3-F5]|uniref:bifunctional fructose-bisphosphatase/inositol-phosphate phosphatase n=1 Tax=Methanosphaera sp. ISO3-F5 TaxID=1452353 RepID=UPI002B25CD5C|nr:bifunctional fructose-bisphosphatase/inositol-phosphate phosphatase [Methanosphaera sp. ISO3-F5]WQH64315.1 bifunctional fructose-bisphosphatase/inositol-phosphate phosphatase [Methanosphaera sp. ISO3-F5]